MDGGSPVRLGEALESVAAVAPEQFDRFRARLDLDWIEEALHATGSATVRRRRLPAQQVVWLVIGMGVMRNRPILDIVDKLDLALPDSKGVGVAPSAVAQARARLGSDPMRWLFARTADQWGHASADAHRWRGLALYGADGTTLRVADSPENRKHFGGQSGRHESDSGYPLVRLVGLMALRSHVLVSASFGPYDSEHIYARDLWSEIPDDSLTVVDRGFATAGILIPLARGGQNRHWLTRASANRKWRTVERLGPGDEIAEIKVDRKARLANPALPPTWHMRAIRYQRKGFAKGGAEPTSMRESGGVARPHPSERSERGLPGRAPSPPRASRAGARKRAPRDECMGGVPPRRAYESAKAPTGRSPQPLSERHCR